MIARLYIAGLQVAVRIAQSVGLTSRAASLGQAKLEAVRRMHGVAS